MKYNLLQLTQEILSAMDSDEVNSILDTTEATQVARCVRQAYYDLIEDLDPPNHYMQYQLTDSGDNTKPTLMTVPTDINSVLWIKYNKIQSGDTAANYEKIPFLEMNEFLKRIYQLSTDDTNVGTFTITNADSENIRVYYQNDRGPTAYTTFGDNNTILFNSYDIAVDTRLTGAKSIAYGKRQITFDLSDATIPELDEPYFSRLLNEAKLLAFAELKSIDHGLAARNAKRSRNRSIVQKQRIKQQSDFDDLPYYGRK